MNENKELRNKTLDNLKRIHGSLPSSAQTEELAALCGVKGATIRRSLCLTGSYLGLVPVKKTNGRLVWILELGANDG